MSYSDDEFFEDFKLVFAVSKVAAQSTSYSSAARQVKSHIKNVNNATVDKKQAVFKITSFSKSMDHARKAIDYITRDNELPLYDGMDNEIHSPDGQSPYRDFLEEVNALNENHYKTKRQVMNFVLSAGDTANSEQFEAATRDFLKEHFGNQPYVYTFHQDTDHYHAHISTGLREYTGERVKTNKKDLLAWRQGFAESLQKQGVDIEATPALSRKKVTTKENKTQNEIKKRGGNVKYKAKEKDASTYQDSIDKRQSALNRMSNFIKEKEQDKNQAHEASKAPSKDKSRTNDDFEL